MARRNRGMKLPLLLVLCALGCGDSTEEDDDGLLPVIVNDLTYEPCDASRRVGQFTVELGDGYTAVQGRALSGVVPANVRKVEAEEGQCRLLLGRTLFCEPTCGASQTCGEDGTCIPYPTAQDLGTVRVLGLEAGLSMTPNSARFYSNGATTLPHPGFEPGADISLVTSGADLPSFSLQGQGVAALEVPGDAITLERGQPVTVSWTPSTASEAARLHLVVDLAHHGGIAASVECDGLEDTGSFTLPAGLLSRLLDEGVAGFPKLTLSRRSADSTDTQAGCVELLVLSQVQRDVLIPGLVSCSTDADCPDGKTCRADLTCQ